MRPLLKYEIRHKLINHTMTSNIVITFLHSHTHTQYKWCCHCFDVYNRICWCWLPVMVTVTVSYTSGVGMLFSHNFTHSSYDRSYYNSAC